MPKTYLHMLYAGRGDAFVIENAASQNGGNDGFFEILDGGPMLLRHVGRRAPYYQYLRSLVRRVSQSVNPNGPVAPARIFLSHWHEDHFGGVMELIENLLSRTYTSQTTNEYPLVFNGPLYAPKPRGAEAIALSNRLRNVFHFTRATQAPQIDGYVIGGPDEIWTYNRAALPILVSRWDIDPEKLNADSLLMWRRASGMVFTGDNLGWRIAQFMQQSCADAGSPPAFRLYKVSHHGSLKNSQLLSANAQINDLAYADYALFVTLNPNAAELPYFPYNLTTDQPLWDRANEMLLKQLAGQHVNVQDLKDQIDSRLQAAIGAFEAGITNWQPILGAGELDTEAIWAALNSAIKADDEFHTFTFTRELTRPSLQRPDQGGDVDMSNADAMSDDYGGHDRLVEFVDRAQRSWTKAFLKRGNHEDFYRNHIAFNQLIAFYSSFTAAAYAISANGEYSHPAAETLAAIASVAKAADRQAHVFLTDADAVYLQGIEDLCGNDWQQFLAIHYLNGPSSVRLDPSEDGAAMDVDGATALLDPNGAVNYSQLHDDFAAGPALAQPGLGPRPLYEIATAANLYLTVGHDNFGNPTPLLTATASRCSIRDWWGTPRIDLRDAEIVDPGSSRSVWVRLIGGPNAFSLGYYTPGANIWTPNRYITTNQANNYLTDDPNNADIAVFTFTPAPLATDLSTAARPGAAPLTDASSFDSYCAAANIPTNAPVAVGDALAAMLGPRALTQLLQKLGPLTLDRTTMAWQVNPDASIVEFTRGPLLAVSGASLQLAVPAGATIEVAGEALAVNLATLSLAWSTTLSVTFDVRTAPGLEIIHAASLADAVRTSKVPDYLIALGVAPADAPAMPLGKVLAVMLGERPAAERMLMNVPAPLLRAKIAAWTLEPGSNVNAVASPLGRIDVASAQLIPTPPPGANFTLTVEGFVFTLSSIVVTVLRPRLARRRVVMTATATLASGLALRAGAELAGDEAKLTLRFPASATLADLVSALPGGPDLGGLDLPQAGALSSFTVSAPGISLKQAAPGTDNFSIASVFLTASYDGWKSWLPPSITPPAQGLVFVEIFRPLSADRQLGVSVFFDLAATGDGKLLQLAFSAIPLPSTEDGYSYTLQVGAKPGTPITLAQGLGALTLTDKAASAIAAVPVLGDVMSALMLDYATLVVEGGAFSEFSLHVLTAAPITLIPGVLTLGAADLSLDYVDGGWQAQVGATLQLAGFVLDVTAALPGPERPGRIAIDNPQDLSIAGFLTAVGLPDPSGVPVIGTLTATEIRHAELTLGYPENQSALAVTQGKVTAVLQNVALGPLEVTRVSLEVTYTTAAGADEDNPQGAGFWLQAALGADGDVTLDVTYDNAKRVLSGQLRVAKAHTLLDLLKSFIPPGSVLDALGGVVGGLAVQDGAVAIGFPDGAGAYLKEVGVDIAASANLSVASLALTGISVDYEVVKTLTGDFVSTTTLAGVAKINLDALEPGQEDFSALRYVLGWTDNSYLQIGASIAITPNKTLAQTAIFSLQYDATLTLISAVRVQGLTIGYQPASMPKFTMAIKSAWVQIPTSTTPYTPYFSGQLNWGEVDDPNSAPGSGKKVPGASGALAMIPDSRGGGDFLGIPHLQLTNLSLAMTWAFDLRRTVEVAAATKIGDVTVAAAIAFENGAATSVSLSMTGGVNLADAFSGCLGVSDWGAAYLPEIILDEGNLSYKAAAKGQPKTFKASCKLTILKRQFEITGTLIDGVGAEIAGGLTQPVDAVILSLTGPDGKTGGPKITLVSKIDGDPSKNRALILSFGLNVYDQIFTDGRLSYFPATNESVAGYSGSLSYKGVLPGFGDVDWTIGAEWDADEGFRIRNWPMSTEIMAVVGKALDLNKLLSQVSGRVGRCPAINLDAAMSGQFRLAVTPVGATDGKLSFQARVSYLFSLKDPLADQWHTIFTSVIDSDTVEVDAPKSFSELMTGFAEAVLKLAPKMVEAMVTDPASSGAIIAVLGAKRLAPDVLNALLCRNPSPVIPPKSSNEPEHPTGPWLPPLPPGPVPTPVPIKGPPGPGDSGSNDSGSDDNGNDPGSGGGGGGAPPAIGPSAADMLRDAQRLLQTGLSAADLAIATSNLADAAAAGSNAASLFPDGADKDQANGVVTAAKAELSRRYAVTNLALTVAPSGRSVTASWAPLDPPDSAVLTIQMQTPSGTMIDVPAGATSQLITDPAISPGATITVTAMVRVIVTTQNALLSLQAPASCTVQIPVAAVPPAKPAGLALTQDAARITASWNAVEAATTYDFQLFADGKLIDAPHTGLTATTITIDLQTVAPGVVIRGQARAGNAVQGEWCDPVEITILPEVDELAVVSDGGTGGLVATWHPHAVPKVAYSYVFELMDSNGAEIGAPLTNLLQPKTPVTVPSLAAGQTYKARVRIAAGGSAGGWFEQQYTIILVTAPANLQIAFDGTSGKLGLGWSASTGASDVTYELGIALSSDGTSIVHQTGLVTANATITPDQAVFRPGSAYKVSVQAVAKGAISAWTTAAFTPLEAPEAMRLAFIAEADPNNSVLTTTATALPGAVYDVRLRAPDNQILFEKSSLADPNLVLKAADLAKGLVEGAELHAIFRATVGNIASPWSSDEAPQARIVLRILPIPTGLQLSFDQAAVTVAWEADPKAPNYELVLTGPEANPQTVSKPAPPVVFARSSQLTFQPGALYRLTARAVDGQCKGPPAAASLTIPQALARVDWKTVGDGLLVYDSTTGLYWLTWTQGTDLSRNQAGAECAPSGRFAGFQFATMDQIERMMSTAHVPNPHGRTAANIPSVQAILATFGANNYFGFLGGGNSSCVNMGSPGQCVAFTIETLDHPTTAKAAELGAVVVDRASGMGHALVTLTKPNLVEEAS